MIRTASAAILVLLVAASLALANPYDTHFDKWAQGGCERAMKTGSLQGITPQGKQEWRKPMSTQRVVTYVSTYVGKQVQEGVNHNDAQMDLLRQQLEAAGSLPKGLPNRMNSDTGETGSIDMKPPTDAAALGAPAGAGPGAADVPPPDKTEKPAGDTAAPPPPAEPGPGAAAPPPPAGTEKPADTPPASDTTTPPPAAPKAATSSMLGDISGVVGLWDKAIDKPVATCVILLFVGFAGCMWQRRKPSGS